MFTFAQVMFVLPLFLFTLALVLFNFALVTFTLALVLLTRLDLILTLLPLSLLSLFSLALAHLLLETFSAVLLFLHLLLKFESHMHTAGFRLLKLTQANGIEDIVIC